MVFSRYLFGRCCSSENYQLQQIYKYIYLEEERTCTTQTYTLEKDCECRDNKTTDIIYDIDHKKQTDICPICYDKYNDNNTPVKLICNHIFHKKCIIKWLDKTCSCPLCRENCNKCEKCNNTRIINYTYNGKIIPKNIRGRNINRNQTDGTFGIVGYDFEDLILHDLYYNREENMLSIFVGA